MLTELPEKSESEVQKSVIALLGKMGITLFRRNVGAFKVEDRFIRCAEPGQSDLYGTDWPANFLWARPWEIEVKRYKKRPTPNQLSWLKTSTARGCVAFWGDNIDTIRRVARAVLDGGRIVWINDGDAFNVEMP